MLDVAKRIEVRPAKVASSAGLRKLLGDHVVQVDCVLAIGLSDTHEELEAFVMSDAIDRLCATSVHVAMLTMRVGSATRSRS